MTMNHKEAVVCKVYWMTTKELGLLHHVCYTMGTSNPFSFCEHLTVRVSITYDPKMACILYIQAECTSGSLHIYFCHLFVTL